MERGEIIREGEVVVDIGLFGSKWGIKKGFD